MLDTTLAIRYAKALHSVAEEKNIVPAILGELNAVISTIEANKKLMSIFMHPAIPVAEKKQLAQELWGAFLSPSTMSFLYMIFDASRIDYLKSIYTAFESLSDTAQHIVHAHVSTVYPLSPEVQASITQRLASILKQDIELSTGVDSTVIGGMKLTIGDKIIDGSVAQRLKELEEHVVVG